MKEQAIYKQPRIIIPFVLLGIAAAYYLITEHNAHVRSALPTVLLLAFVLMHMRMHGGHGGGHSHGSSDDQQTSTQPDKDQHTGHGGHK